MPQQEYQIISAIVVTIIVFLIIGFFIVILVAYINQRKKKHLEEKQEMQTNFQQELLRTQLEIQEQTFNHISQEIHDNVGQILSLAKVQINIMNESVNVNNPMLDQVKENIGKALSDLRGIAKRLSNERIRDLSILDAVRIETEPINKTGIINANVSVKGDERKMDEQKKQMLFRIIQECLQNVIKHAECSRLEIDFCYLPEKMEVFVRDNGKGFDVDKALSDSDGLGLQNIRTRVSLIGGELLIESTISKGSTFIIKIPHE